MTRSALMLPALAASLLLLAACGGGGGGKLSMNPSGSVPFDRSVSVSGVGQSPRVSVTCIDLILLYCSVSWTGNDLWDDVIVYRSTVDDPSTATEIGRGWSQMSFLDNSVVSGTRYYYWVAFEDSSGQQSSLSPSASACAAYFGQSCGKTPPPPPPAVADTGAARETADHALARDLAFPANGQGFTHVGADPGARVSRAALLSYLQGEARQHRNGLLRFDEQPVVRVRSNVPESGLNHIEAVVGLLNLYLPADWQLEFDRDAPAVARSIPEDGEILIDYSRSRSWGAGSSSKLGASTKYVLGSTIEKALVRVDDSKAGDRSYYVLAHEILHALGRHHPTDGGQATIMQPVTPADDDDLPAFLLHPLDAEALLAVYSRLEAGDAPARRSADRVHHWLAGRPCARERGSSAGVPACPRGRSRRGRDSGAPGRSFRRRTSRCCSRNCREYQVISIHIAKLFSLHFSPVAKPQSRYCAISTTWTIRPPANRRVTVQVGSNWTSQWGQVRERSSLKPGPTKPGAGVTSCVGQVCGALDRN